MLTPDFWGGFKDTEKALIAQKERLQKVLEAIKERPLLTHVVLTGRGAPNELIEDADLVTEMSLIHHPFREQGIKAQAGIEF